MALEKNDGRQRLCSYCDDDIVTGAFNYFAFPVLYSRGQEGTQSFFQTSANLNTNCVVCPLSSFIPRDNKNSGAKDIHVDLYIKEETMETTNKILHIVSILQSYSSTSYLFGLGFCP